MLKGPRMTEFYRLYSSLPLQEPPRAVAEIDLSALRHNYRYLKAEAERSSSDSRPICVVKADAYGHGAPACVRVLLEEGCDFFAVSCLNEAVAVREVCRSEGKEASILILGYTDPSLARSLAEEDLIQIDAGSMPVDQFVELVSSEIKDQLS